jgi:hypothetical protein
MPIRRGKWLLGLPAAVVLSVIVATAATQGNMDQPDADFLEFLGSWSTGESHPRWIDPFQFDDPTVPESERPDQQRMPRNRQDDLRKKPRDVESPTTQPTPDSVRSGEGVKP